MSDPKVLIISHTPFNSANSMGSTLGAYFTEYNPECVAQFYIKGMNPDMDVCNNYFCVTDSEILSKCKNPLKKRVGRAFKLGEKPFPEKLTAAPSEGAMAKSHRALGLIIRNALWSISPWKTKEFKKWVTEFNPDVILVQPGDFTYILKLAVRLSKKLQIPLCVHQSEAYYLKRTFETTFPYKFYYRGFRRHFRKMMQRADMCIYLCDALKQDYDKCFATPSKTIMKPTALPLEKDRKPFDKEKLKFIYAGNLGLAVGRAEPLLDIGRALKAIGYSIDVYSSTRGEHLSELTPENGIIMHEAVPYSKLQKIIKESDFLVHTEAFDDWHKLDLKYAFSTKIADMLSSGRCAIIYAPYEIASTAYFKDNNLALVVEEKEKLQEEIKKVIENSFLREKYIENALNQAENFHNAQKNAMEMKETLEMLVK